MFRILTVMKFAFSLEFFKVDFENHGVEFIIFDWSLSVILFELLVPVFIHRLKESEVEHWNCSLQVCQLGITLGDLGDF